ncbi:MAG: methionine--tRNA ligase [Candidatus Aenigmatarchaeota archaeon]
MIIFKKKAGKKGNIRDAAEDEKNRVFLNNEKILITSALPYVNGIKHLGNIIGSLLPADIFHRFLDLIGIENIYICGTDEHGTAIEIAALEEGITPKEYADKYYELQKRIYEKWGFDFTYFGRTSSPAHHELTKNIFTAIFKAGYIKKESVTLPYCRNCRRFLPDRFVLGECPKCKYQSARGDQCESCSAVLDPTELKNSLCSVCKKSEIEFRQEEHLFLDLLKLQPKLENWLKKNNHWPSNVRNIALGWLNEGLKPRCITRNLSWGVAVPLTGYHHLVFYVWFDAPIGYISFTMEGEQKKLLTNADKWWSDAKIYHFLGKDNIPFHTVFWPAILIASSRTESLPYYVAGYEYLNWQGEKFSTSRGIGLFSDEALELFPIDYWRYYLSRIMPENKDSNFDWDDFRSKINNELIANYGNLFYRVTSFIHSNIGSVPEPGKIGKEEKEIEKFFIATCGEIEKLTKEVKLKEALERTMTLASAANRYFQEKKPWKTFSADRKDACTTLYYSVNLVRIISTLLLPYIPTSAQKAIDALGIKEKKWKFDFSVKPGQYVKPVILFKKIDDAEIKKAVSYKTKYAKKEIAEKGIKEMPYPEIVTGSITSVEDHPDAEKLYVIRVNIGSSERQIVSSLKDSHTKDELDGKQILMLINLKPAKFRGIVSDGMLLACDDDTLLVPKYEIKNGTVIQKGSGQLKAIDFSSHDFHIEMHNGEQVAVLDGLVLSAGNVPIIPEKKVNDGCKVL